MRLPRAVRADDGMTMVDVLISMVVMGVVASMMTAGIVQLNRSTSRAEAASIAQSQVAVAMTRIDRQVRYANRLNATGDTVTYEVVETGGNRCYQTRSAGGALQQRSKAIPGEYGGWATLATGVVGASFTAHEAADEEDHQRLTVTLVARAPGATTTQSTTITYTALNTTSQSPTTAC